MATTGERAKPGDAGGGTDGSGARPSVAPTLKHFGISKTESSQWQGLASLGDADFELRVQAMKKQAVSRTALNNVGIRERRHEREAELGVRQYALPSRRYGVIYPDPPWPFEGYSSETSQDRGPARHYPPMTLDAIKALDVPSIAADDCALFLWTPGPTDDQAHEVIRAWGFTYKSQFVWVKPSIGMGYWCRSQHELLLVATRGDIPAPAPGEQWPSVIFAPAREHSRKPDEGYQLIESYYPSLPKIELFARSARPEWDRWGAEAPAEVPSAAEA